MAHHAYLRPGELDRLTWDQVHPGQRRPRPLSFPSITLHPAERGQQSKTREFDESLVIDWEWLATALLRMRARSKPQANVTGCTQAEFANLLTDAARVLKLNDSLGDIVPYRLRHSGPTADAAGRRRDLPEIKLRGRWRTDASMRRYQKGARVNDLLSRCSLKIRAYAERCLVEFPKTLAGRREPLPPPP